MKTWLLSILIILFFLVNISSQPDLQWASTYSEKGIDKGIGIAVDSDGNSYVACSSEGTATGSDYLIIKYDANGDTIWTKKFNGSGNGADEPVAIKIDKAYVYVTGTSKSDNGTLDMVTIKYNQLNGDLIWQKIYSGNGTANGDDKAYNMFVDETGNMYVVGSTFSFVGSSYLNQGIVIKYNPTGSILWTFKRAANDYINLIAINPSTGIVTVTDYLTLADYYLIYEIDPQTGKLLYYHNSPDFLQSSVAGVAKSLVLNPSGTDIYVTSSSIMNPNAVTTARWKRGIGTDVELNLKNLIRYHYCYFPFGGGFFTGVDSKLDIDNNVYVLASINTGGQSDYFIIKYGFSLDSLWSARFNSSAGVDDVPVSLSVNNSIKNADIYVTGYTVQTGNIITLGYDANGNRKWRVDYDCGTSGIDVVGLMTLDKNDNIYLTGYSVVREILEM